MNIREYSDWRCSNSKKYNKKYLIVLLSISIPSLVFVLAYSYFFFVYLMPRNYFDLLYFLSWIIPCIISILVQRYLLRKYMPGKIDLGKAFSDSTTMSIKFIICHSCLKTISLFTSDNEFWNCNYCGEKFKGSILRDCPNCGKEQRLFSCFNCSATIDIDATYNQKELEKRIYDEQTKISLNKYED